MVDKHHGIDHGVPVLRRPREEGAGHREAVGRPPGGHVEVHLVGELVAVLIEGGVRPVPEPVEDASVEQGQGRGYPVTSLI